MKYRLLFLLPLLFTLPAQAQETNYSHDPETWTECDALVEKYSCNMDIQMLHAVRISLFAGINKKTLHTRIGIHTISPCRRYLDLIIKTNVCQQNTQGVDTHA